MVIKRLFLFKFLLIIFSCKSNLVNKRFTMINTNKEWDIELRLLKDSTFVLKDMYGCNRMAQKGSWEVIENVSPLFSKTILLKDNKINPIYSTNFHDFKIITYKSTLDGKEYKNKVVNQYPLIKSDTLYFNKKNKLIFRNHIYKVFNGSLEKKRVAYLEKFYINKMGKKLYIETIGDGESLKSARMKLKECKNY